MKRHFVSERKTKRARFICAPPGRFDALFAGSGQGTKPTVDVSDHDQTADGKMKDVTETVAATEDSADTINTFVRSQG